MKPGGLGPWFCGLLFNTNTRSKKQTHVTAHTNLELVELNLNRQLYTKSFDKTTTHVGWVLMIKIGPFTSWRQTVQVVKEWTNKTRGKGPRLQRGIDLFRSLLQTNTQIYMWCQTILKNDLIKQRKQHKKRKIPKMTINDIENTSMKRRKLQITLCMQIEDALTQTEQMYNQKNIRIKNVLS